MGVPRLTPEQRIERFWSYVDKASDCWLWTGSIKAEGYGQFGTPEGPVYAHRTAYELLVGPIPEGLVIDHLCRVRRCVNPEHMEVVTDRENILRGRSRSAVHARKTHCLRGHEFTPENTHVDRHGWRTCRECIPIRFARRRVADCVTCGRYRRVAAKEMCGRCYQRQRLGLPPVTEAVR